MSELFYIIDSQKSPTREESSTIGRKTGEDFLKDYYPENRIKYGGYIVVDGQIAPFWRFEEVPAVIIQNLHHLSRQGYIGRIEKSY